jgi:hypothetical protein
MKHIKKFENKDLFDEDLLEIKSILRELKDEYPYIEGQVFLTQSDLIEIHLNCENIFSTELRRGTLEFNKSKMKFIELVISTIERLELSLNKTTHTVNLWNWDHWQDLTIKITVY